MIKACLLGSATLSVWNPVPKPVNVKGSAVAKPEILNLTSSTFVMNKIKSLINSEPEVRTDRVAELKDRIKSGEYKIDSDKLAKKMIEDAFQEDVS